MLASAGVVPENGGLPGEDPRGRPVVEPDRPAPAPVPAPPAAVPGPQALRQPAGPDGDSLRAQDGHPVGVPADRVGLWVGHDVLASAACVAARRGLDAAPSRVARAAACRRPARLVAGDRRFRLHPRPARGEKPGPNPTDRRKLGSKQHLITDGRGIPLAGILTEANRHAVTQRVSLVEAIPPIRGKVGRPRQRPARVQGDRAYDSEPHRRHLRAQGITPVLAHRRTPYGSGLGVFRWVVERTMAWLHQFRRLRIRAERRDDIHEAFLDLGAALICWNFLNPSLC